MRRGTTHIKFDANHKQLCADIRKQGVEVVEIMEPVDTLCLLNKFIGLVELKPEGRGTYTRKQLKFISETRLPVAIARNAAEAMGFLKTGKGLSQRQKDALAAFLVTHKADKWNSELVERELTK